MRKRLERRMPIDPDAVLLTVEEAASILRIGRSSAYMLANVYLATEGAAGLPVIRLGRCLRVPSARLQELIGAHLPATTTSSETSTGSMPAGLGDSPRDPPASTAPAHQTADARPAPLTSTRGPSSSPRAPSTNVRSAPTKSTRRPSDSTIDGDATDPRAPIARPSDRRQEGPGTSLRTPRNSTHQCISDAATPLPFDFDAESGAGGGW